ncbi:Peptidase propeptide and YPEB domain-containing protein [Halopseudomonas xinjiangensis]|uniref:Peptidase propeptide and YPEB domain-containing protein n=1 Tax=Halopseudomonas xinjiangensis TaxID=487184 RepID=A0A1H1T5T0_9GAMM|nr:PepSY domain-containing protein [Halopseudomonas xinjiangensis]SDS55501.1 Peptidase propeptide and YPEB domain-containing protein [Halopseudomonas xinjiangensis]
MQTKLITALVGSACLLIGSQTMAATAGEAGMSIEDAIKKARSLGYTEIEEIEADGDEWEGQGKKEGDEEYEFRIDRKSGEVLKDEED